MNMKEYERRESTVGWHAKPISQLESYPFYRNIPFHRFWKNS